MKRTTWALLALCCAACVSTSGAPERVNVVTPMPREIGSILIQVAPMKAGSMKNIQGLNDAPQRFAREVMAALKLKRPDWQIALADPTAGGANADLLVAAEILEMDGGSASSRFWIGFGAGKARSTAQVSIRDRDGRELASAVLSQATSCPTGACTESNEAMVLANLKDLAADAAAFISNPIEFRQRVHGASK